MSYSSGSLPKSPSGFDVQGPAALPASAFSKAFQPTVNVIYEKCNRIIINADTGSCFLLFNTSASIGTTMDVADGTDSVLNFQDQQNGSTQEIGGKIFTYATGSYGGTTQDRLLQNPAQTLDLPVGAMAFSGSDGFDSSNITFIYNGGL